MEQLEPANPSLQKIFERAQMLRLELGGQRYFPTVVNQIIAEISGGYALSTQEKATIQAGILSCQSLARIEIIIPMQPKAELLSA